MIERLKKLGNEFFTVHLIKKVIWIPILWLVILHVDQRGKFASTSIGKLPYEFLAVFCLASQCDSCFFSALGLSLYYLSDSFGLRHWFKFGVPVVSSPPSFDSSTEVSMVEGMLTLLITLLSTRLHLGNVTYNCVM